MEAVRLGRLVLELNFVLTDEAGSEVEAAALEVMVERVVVVGRLISSAAVVDALTGGALRALEDQGHGLEYAMLPVGPVLLVRSISIRALCRGHSSLHCARVASCFVCRHSCRPSQAVL